MLMILLANMLILAHAVVPHHHHNKVFVAIVNVWTMMPEIGALVHNVGSVLVVLNAALLYDRKI
jgi:cation transport ATPase